eukprot:Gb_39828 [translate_table: standard]
MILQLQLIVKKLHKLEHSLRRANGYACSPKKPRPLFSYESDEEWRAMNSCESIPADVPEDHLAVYAGSDQRRRFIVRIGYLNHPVFRALLDKAEEEFGFDQKGGLVIPCDPILIERLLCLLRTNDPAVNEIEVEEFMIH